MVDVLETIQGLTRSFQDRLTASTAYGEPIVANGVTVVPVAKVCFGFGGGFGNAPGTQTDRPPGEGAGGAAGDTTGPVGVIEITSAGTRFRAGTRGASRAPRR